jgi:hypothetical protein
VVLEFVFLTYLDSLRCWGSITGRCSASYHYRVLGATQATDPGRDRLRHARRVVGPHAGRRRGRKQYRARVSRVHSDGRSGAQRDRVERLAARLDAIEKRLCPKEGAVNGAPFATVHAVVASLLLLGQERVRSSTVGEPDCTRHLPTGCSDDVDEPAYNAFAGSLPW